MPADSLGCSENEPQASFEAEPQDRRGTPGHAPAEYPRPRLTVLPVRIDKLKLELEPKLELSSLRVPATRNHNAVNLLKCRMSLARLRLGRSGDQEIRRSGVQAFRRSGVRV